MAHPRVRYPLAIIPFYLRNGLKKTCAEYRTCYHALTRFLRENQIPMRKRGDNIMRGFRVDKEKAATTQSTTTETKE